MKNVLSILIISVITSCVSAQTKSVKTVSFVDLTKFLGTWYEVANIPQSFQKKCIKNTTANYSLKNHRKIKVINSCLEADGSVKQATGQARIVDTNSNAKLKVSFAKILGIFLPFSGDYWIIDLATDYSYALIGHPSQKYAWILTRSPAVSKETLIRADTVLKSNGYDTCLLLTSIQDGGFNKRLKLCDVVKKLN
jgi:apolipoprotein D and lipocalin family protein